MRVLSTRETDPLTSFKVVCDLSEPGLQRRLEAAGFDASRPTLWVVEGVTYYITLDANARLLSESAAASPAGSRLVATHIPRENLDANRACDAASPLARLFTVCVEDVLASGMLAAGGWGDVAVSCDIAGVARQRCGGAECYYPYSLAYSGGQRLGCIEVILEATRL